MKTFFANWFFFAVRLLFWLTLVVVAVLSLWPGDAHPPTSPWSDKFGHGLAYFVLGLQWIVGWFGSLRNWLIGLAVLWLYSGLMEMVQATAIIGRTASGADLLANGAGLLLALACGLLIRSRLAKSKS